MEVIGWIVAHYSIFGIAATVILLAGIFISFIVYRGTKGQKYSPLNHFISELGEIGVSKAAWGFNYGLIISGLIFVPFMLGLGLTINTTWSLLAMAAGLWAVISFIMVGFFPMNQLEPHGKVAISYFRAGLVSMLLFSIAILLQPMGHVIVPKYVAVFGAVAFLAYANFLVIITVMARKNRAKLDTTLDPTVQPERPRFSALAFSEWLVFFAQMVWFLMMALV